MTPPELKISPDAEYVTSGGAEIRFDNVNGLWSCHFYRGGELPDILKGQFLTKSDLRRAVVRYLESDNVRGNAQYPKDVDAS